MVLIAPDHIPEELGGSYADACRALELEPEPGGYAVYLIDELNTRAILVSADTAPLRETKPDLRPGDHAWFAANRVAIMSVLTSPGVVGLRLGWPVELGGDPRCQFCRDPEPAWVYEGADVRVRLGKPLLDIGPPDVLGTDVVGVMDWTTCQACHELIQASEPASYQQLLQRYGDELPPMPLQAAWREFWINHRRRARPCLRPPWTAARRRRMAHDIRTHWTDWRARFPLDQVTFTGEPLPELAGMDAALDAARTYLDDPPPFGRVRAYPATDAAPELVRADGNDWSLIGALGDDPAAFALLDSAPETLHPARGPQTTILLRGLALLAHSS